MGKSELSPGLYLVAVPIGHPDDLSIRALRVLSEVEVIACEDTRVTNRLLTHHGLKKSLICYNDFSTARDRTRLLARIEKGERVALVSDAGTPLISDPGYKLVQAAYAENMYVTSLPGASSVMMALTLAGLPTHRFLFEGFLPPKSAARQQALKRLKNISASLVFFESPARAAESIKDMETVFGNREAALLRELTKPYEEVTRGTLSFLYTHYAETPPRGEVVIVVAPPSSNNVDEETLDTRLLQLLGSYRLKDAVQMVVEEMQLPRNMVYQRALALNEKEQGDARDEEE